MIEYTVKVYANGTKEWHLNGKRHREDGPAIEWADGSEFWYLNDKLHREDGPAIEWADGAIEWADGDKEWYLNGEKVTEEEVMNPAEEMTMEEICKALGKNVKVIK